MRIQNHFLGYGLLFWMAHQQVSAQSGSDLAELYIEALGQYSAFPPLDSDPEIYTNENLNPVQVVTGQVLLSIDSISPGSNEFTATTRTITYWKAEDCNQTVTQQYACDTNLGSGLRFFNQDNASSSPRIILSVEQPDIHATVFDDAGLSSLTPDAQLRESQTTYAQSFDVRHYPWEVHGLEVSYTSLYSSNLVQVSRFADFEKSAAPSVPSGWTYHGSSCGLSKTNGGRVVSENGIGFVNYSCKHFVSRTNAGWWVTSFLLYASLIFTAFAGSVGVMSHMIAEARDDRDSARRALFDGTRLIGTFTVGLLLTYVFQVEISPYGQPVEHWPRIPTSTMIYCLGLVGIFVQSFAGLFGSLFFRRPLLSEGFVGALTGPYDIDNCPKEGEVSELRGPLLLKKYSPSSTDSADSGDVPEAAPQEDEAKPQIATTRQANTKRYNVLSVEEAVVVNNFVKDMFFFKLSLLFILALVTVIILAVARSGYGNLIDEVEEKV